MVWLNVQFKKDPKKQAAGSCHDTTTVSHNSLLCLFVYIPAAQVGDAGDLRPFPFPSPSRKGMVSHGHTQRSRPPAFATSKVTELSWILL